MVGLKTRVRHVDKDMRRPRGFSGVTFKTSAIDLEDPDVLARIAPPPELSPRSAAKYVKVDFHVIKLHVIKILHVIFLFFDEAEWGYDTFPRILKATLKSPTTLIFFWFLRSSHRNFLDSAGRVEKRGRTEEEDQEETKEEKGWKLIILFIK